ncbi:thiamine pyrophosphate-binding protein [Georgenia sp.]
MTDHLTRGSTGAQGVARVVVAMDDPIVFGLPGGHTVEIFDALRDLGDDIEAVLVREESLATVMAEAYGRFTTRPAVVMAQGAWILGAGGIGVMEAHLGASPMVILLDATEGGTYSHHGPYQSGFGGYGAFDLPAAMAAITKRTFVATDPVQAVEMTQLAIAQATVGEPGPVAVVFHSRALLGAVSDDDARRICLAPRVPAPPPHPDGDAVVAAGARLNGAHRPVILAGNGARPAAAELRALAEHLRAPVVTTPGGKGVLPEDHPLALGVIGSFGHDAANRVLGAADVVVAVGTKIGATDTMEEHPDLIDGTRQTIVQIDVEPLNLGWTQRVAHPLLGRAQDVLPLLAAHVAQRPADRTGWAEEIRAGARVLKVPELAEDDRVNPRALAALLSELLPDDAVVTCDAGENRLFMLHDYMVRPGGTLIQPNGGGGMGYAVPAAIAATYALPGRLAVAVLGDGGYAMSLHGLMTAVEQRRHLLVVVMDNQALGWVLHGQGERPYMSTFEKFDLAAIAGSIGCTTTVAHTREEIAGAVQRATTEPAVHVLVVPTSLSESFLTLRSPMAGASHEEVGAGRE